MSKISQNILDQITKGEIKPKSRLYFVFLRILFWSLFILSVFIGSIATGMMFNQALGSDWGLMKHVPTLSHGLFMFLPFLCWFGVLVIVLGFACYIFHKTKKGYRYSPALIVSASILMSIVLGFVSYNTHYSQGFEKIMRNNFGPYRMMQEYRENMWVNPEEGSLAGKIQEVTDGSFTFEDITGELWTVYFEEDVELSKQSIIESGQRAFITGDATSEDEFHATIITVLGENSRSPLFND